MKKILSLVVLSLFIIRVSYAEQDNIDEYETYDENVEDTEIYDTDAEDDDVSADDKEAENKVDKVNDLKEGKKESFASDKEADIEDTIKKQSNKESSKEENSDEAGNEETSEEASDEEDDEEYIKNPTDFSPRFMSSLYQCQPDIEQQTIYSIEETVVILGQKNGKCHLKYDMFDLYIPTGLISNIHSIDDIRQLLYNNDISYYRPEYNYDGLLFEIEECRKHKASHSTRLERLEKHDITIIRGLTSVYENNQCVVRFLNQLSMGAKFQDYSVVCNINMDDVELINQRYGEIIKSHMQNPQDEAIANADMELMYLLQQAGYCKKITK